jgi:fibrillarin-like pre-rRNA processing protein
MLIYPIYDLLVAYHMRGFISHDSLYGPVAEMSENIKWHESRLYTRNLVPGVAVYWEVLRRFGGTEYRLWDPKRSKLAAYLYNKGNAFPFETMSTVLYLGAASGTTVSHISDVVTGGRIFAVEVAKNPFRDLLALAEIRGNIIPILEDANHPEKYQRLVREVDVLYQDIAQRNQTEIFIKNSRLLKPGGYGFLMIKARCIDVSLPPSRIYKQCAEELKKASLRFVGITLLGPYEKDHAAMVVGKEA